MTVNEWLNRGWELDKYINALLAEQKAALDNATSVTASMSGERVQCSSGNSSENKFLKYTEYSELIDNNVDRLVDTKAEIVQAIGKLDNNILKALLINRYIRFMTWEQIAEKMNISEKWARTGLHCKALKKIGEVIPLPDNS